MKTKSSYWYQKNVWPTLEAIESLVERWRLWQTGRGRPLSRQDNEAFFAWANHIVQGRSTRHFRRSQVGKKPWYEAGNDLQHARRLDAFLKLLLDPRYTWPKDGREHRSPGWLVATYKRRYPEMETMGELKVEYGIGISHPQYDNAGEFMGYIEDGDKYLAMRHWTEAARIERLRLERRADIAQLRDVWEEDTVAHGKRPSNERWNNFKVRYAKYVALKQLRHNDLDTTAEFLRQHELFGESYHDG